MKEKRGKDEEERKRFKGARRERARDRIRKERPEGRSE